MPQNSFRIKVASTEVLNGGVIVDVTTVEQAQMAEKVGARAVVVLEKVPADIREVDGVGRMPSVTLIKQVRGAISIPVIVKVRVGHFIEAQIAESIGADLIDESEILTPADKSLSIYKHNFKRPFICGASTLGEALTHIAEGATMLRTKGDPGSGNVSDAVGNLRDIYGAIRVLRELPNDGVTNFAQKIGAPVHLVWEVKNLGRLPVPFFAAGGIVTPADAAMLMHLGCNGIFIGSGIFKASDSEKRAKAIILATANYKDVKLLAEVSSDMGEDMDVIEQMTYSSQDKIPEGGW